MKESVEIAKSVCGVSESMHVNAVGGGGGMEGPSAGVAIAVAMESGKRKVGVRSGIAMSGEISVRGIVMKIGGVLEKVMAAKREGIQDIILPEENRREFEEIKDEVRRGVKPHFVREFKEVLKIVFGE